MSVIFTTAQRKDISEILEMMADFYAIDNYPFDAVVNQKNLERFLKGDNLGRLYLIREGSNTVGYIVLTFGFSFEYGGRDAFIDEFYLKPAYRAKGIGTKTMEFVEQAALTLDIIALHLEVENHNERANQLYIRRGFTGNNRSLLTKKIKSTNSDNSYISE
ncbi:MAG: GNAT family N-acetyltransferase [Cyclobacteriaceae bacterium]